MGGRRKTKLQAPSARETPRLPSTKSQAPEKPQAPNFQGRSIEKGERSSVLVLGVLLVLFVLAMYLPSIGNEFVNYDDGVYVTANIHVQGGFTLESLRWAFGN